MAEVVAHDGALVETARLQIVAEIDHTTLVVVAEVVLDDGSNGVEIAVVSSPVPIDKPRARDLVVRDDRVLVAEYDNGVAGVASIGIVDPVVFDQRSERGADVDGVLADVFEAVVRDEYARIARRLPVGRMRVGDPVAVIPYARAVEMLDEAVLHPNVIEVRWLRAAGGEESDSAGVLCLLAAAEFPVDTADLKMAEIDVVQRGSWKSG